MGRWVDCGRTPRDAVRVARRQGRDPGALGHAPLPWQDRHGPRGAKPSASWSGSGRYDGDAGYTYEVTVVDNGNGGGKSKTPDTFAIVIRDGSGAVVLSTSGPLGGGNLKVH